ncbi:unnamed protein product [Ophioblennius macclurei]
MSDTIYPKESVYNCTVKEESPTSKPPRYVSKFRPTVLQENKSRKDLRRTMGPPKVEAPAPHQYLKKHAKEPKLPEKTQCSKELHKTCTCTEKKPKVPARTDNPPMGIRTNRNFIKTTESIVPKKPQPISVDTYKGHKQALENSGLVPKYIKKKDFGEVPVYLQQRSEEERRAQEEYDDFVREQRDQNAMQHLSDEERQAILKGLKSNWDKLHHEYQGLSLVIDTPSKKTHKQRLEEGMKELEKDIDLIQRFKTIYITKH